MTNICGIYYLNLACISTKQQILWMIIRGYAEGFGLCGDAALFGDGMSFAI